MFTPDLCLISLHTVATNVHMKTDNADMFMCYSRKNTCIIFEALFGNQSRSPSGSVLLSNSVFSVPFSLPTLTFTVYKLQRFFWVKSSRHRGVQERVKKCLSTQTSCCLGMSNYKPAPADLPLKYKTPASPE
jgi:hypothetical protein